MKKKILYTAFLVLCSGNALALDDERIYLDFQGDARSLSRGIMQRLHPIPPGAKSSMFRSSNYFPVENLGKESGIVLHMNAATESGSTAQGNMAGSGGGSVSLLYQCGLKELPLRLYISNITSASFELGRDASNIGSNVAENLAAGGRKLLNEEANRIAASKAICQDLIKNESRTMPNSSIRAGDKPNSTQPLSPPRTQVEIAAAEKESLPPPEWSKGMKKGEKCSTKLPCGPALDCVSGICTPNW